MTLDFLSCQGSLNNKHLTQDKKKIVVNFFLEYKRDVKIVLQTKYHDAYHVLTRMMLSEKVFYYSYPICKLIYKLLIDYFNK